MRVLHSERDLIAKNLIDQLPTITQEKVTLIEELRNTESTILVILKDALGEEAAKDLPQSIHTLDSSGQFQLSALLLKARELAQQCKRDNEINSQIVDASCENVEEVLDVLLGREKTAVYSADGKTGMKGRGSLGEA